MIMKQNYIFFFKKQWKEGLMFEIVSDGLRLFEMV